MLQDENDRIDKKYFIHAISRKLNNPLSGIPVVI